MFNLSLRNVGIPLPDQAALKKALEESLKLLDLKLTYAQEQLFPSSSNEKYTLIHAGIRGIIRREATKAIGFVTFASPISLPVGAKLFTQDGREYTVKISATNAFSALIESLASGFEQNLSAGEELTLFSPVGFVTGGTVGREGIVGANDVESIESLKQRVIDRWRANSEFGSTRNFYEWIQKTRILKAGVFPAYPVPGCVTWAGLVQGAAGSFVLPTAEIQAEIFKELETKRPPGVKVFYLKESKITPINLSIKSQTKLTAESSAQITQSLKSLFFDRSFAKGAAEFEENLPVSENLVRLTIFQALGDSNPFELTITPTGKLGSNALDLGEYLLLGGVTFV